LVNYIIDRDIDGNPYPKTAQTARCGNSVSPVIPDALVRANLPELCEAGNSEQAM
jgi:DNA (cytosine-5)-methyltransferase 1